ncbi:AP-3 complex subunit sigma [Kwoniella mangroviensis CBS 10435]|uniref:AP complex subunit sigma n=1 Tax=Kwoniella mangroviensis CBS 10435 TaxID=1331196 RepID=A0A1B9IKW6_9TREE|nr:AP-3 complex subunit sigma [Kwoniella mangroviensis CBS 8507]OCF56123.1 AP-3 complex subunit sigma [Kwoniella mangroviensis CBS 10435]OCF65030.1 AP-3 complex subunit sigma [Kwoniella mangroviensis CBS 8507]OCF78872.1 AP-3 complex subunit sigma [Kwoniella mangroviensis CBS 8886]
MIHAVLIFNTHGKPRLSKFFTPLPPLVQQSLISQIFSLISDRPAGVCNFLDAPDLVFPTPGSTIVEKGKRKEGDDTRVIYRHYATLYFVFVVDGAESELGILDLIQVFVESLDRSFENVCELDLIFHFDEVHHVLSEIIQGGLVLETNINEISACVQAASRNRKASAASSNPLIPSVLVVPGGRGGSRGGSADGARRWLTSIGV